PDFGADMGDAGAVPGGCSGWVMRAALFVSGERERGASAARRGAGRFYYSADEGRQQLVDDGPRHQPGEVFTVFVPAARERLFAPGSGHACERWGQRPERRGSELEGSTEGSLERREQQRQAQERLHGPVAGPEA